MLKCSAGSSGVDIVIGKFYRWFWSGHRCWNVLQVILEWAQSLRCSAGGSRVGTGVGVSAGGFGVGTGLGCSAGGSGAGKRVGVLCRWFCSGHRHWVVWQMVLVQ